MLIQHRRCRAGVPSFSHLDGMVDSVFARSLLPDGLTFWDSRALRSFRVLGVMGGMLMSLLHGGEPECLA